MDIRRLGHIVALADRRNFARAAQQLALSQPALTRSIQAAEAEYGMRLFDRGPAEVTPTPAGEFVIERARRLLFDSRCLRRDVDLYRDRKLGDVSFGFGPFPAETVMPDLVAMIRTSYPEARLRVEVGNWESLARQLRAEHIELFVADVRDVEPGSELSIRSFRRERGAFFVRPEHPLASLTSVSLAQLWHYGVASVRLPTSVQRSIAGLLGLSAGAALPLALECDHIATLKRAAMATNTALAITPAAVTAELDRGELLPLVIHDLGDVYSEVGIVTLRGRSLSPLAQLTMSHLGDPMT